MKLPFTGGCACGAIRYECTAEPLEMFQCHCRDCQGASGGVCNYVVIVPRMRLSSRAVCRATPSPRARAIGHPKRGFCAELGSRLPGGGNRKGTSPFVGINAASLKG